jgi:NifB/MoaA-like Fe-S oxidoreductase
MNKSHTTEILLIMASLAFVKIYIHTINYKIKKKISKNFQDFQQISKIRKFQKNSKFS